MAPPFIIKLVSGVRKQQIKERAKNLKPKAPLMGGSNMNKLFFNEHLTKNNLEILMATKNLKENYFIWMKNGSIMGRKKKGVNNKAFRLNTVEAARELESKTQKTGSNTRTLVDRSPETNMEANRRLRKSVETRNWK